MTSLTVLVWLGLYVGLALAGLVNPLYAVLGYFLEYYQRPSLHWWGKGIAWQGWNLPISAVLILSALVHTRSLRPLDGRVSPVLPLLLAAVANTYLVTMWAVQPATSLEFAVRHSKIVMVAVVMHHVVRTPSGLNAVVAANIVGATTWGLDALDKRRTQARLEGIGSSDTGNSNSLAAHLLTVMPFLALWVLRPPRRWCRLLAFASAPLVVNLFVLANSRGATLGLLAGGLYTYIFAGKGRRLGLAVAGIVGVLALYLLADPQFIERQSTAANTQEATAQSRLDTWRGAARLIADYPLGSGGRGFHSLSPAYIPDITDLHDGQGRSAHSTYVQTAADWGIQGLLVFLGLVVTVVWSLRQSRRRSPPGSYLGDLSVALEAALIAFTVAGLFSDFYYNEAFYWLCALSLSVERMTITASPMTSASPATR